MINEKKFPSQAVILVGGLGTRLKNFTKKTPKPLLKLDGNTFVDYQINFLSRYQFEEIILLCHYKKKEFKKLYHNKIINNCKIKCVFERSLSGTAGSIINAKKYLKNTFFLLNGDTFFEIDLIKFFKSFSSNNTNIHIAVKKTHKPERYHRVILKKNLITEFTNFNVKSNDYFNCGYYILHKKIFNQFKKIPLSLEKDIFPKLAKKKQISFEKFNNYLLDIGTIEDLRKARKFFKTYNQRKFVILDRDNVINFDKGYRYKLHDFKFVSGAFKLLKNLYKMNVPTYIVTNQAGVARGKFKYSDLLNLNKSLKKLFLRKGFVVNQIYFCPHHKDGIIKKYKKNCKFRKPYNNFYYKIKKQWFLKSNDAVFIDDKIENLQFSKKSKIFGYQFNPYIDINLYNFFLKIQKKCKWKIF